jgi:hypothetical protein
MSSLSFIVRVEDRNSCADNTIVDSNCNYSNDNHDVKQQDRNEERSMDTAEASSRAVAKRDGALVKDTENQDTNSVISKRQLYDVNQSYRLTSHVHTNQ